MNLYLDIETIPSIEPKEEDAKDITAPASYKKPEVIEKYINDKKASYVKDEIKKRSVSIYDNRIICLGYAFDDDEPASIVGGSEEEILRKFEDVVLEYCKANGGSPEGATLIGHNIKAFDAPSIFLKACKYKLATLQSMFYFGRKDMIDTMVLGSYFKYGAMVSMDNLCRFFGIEGKSGMDGSKVYPAWKEGRIEDIAEYCRDDVKKTRQLEKLLTPY
jgi:predicted PolB exonuclease-like 3'-5' exonuclease